MTNLSFDRYLHTLPIGEVAPSVNDALRDHSAVVVTAPPGAGKSTLLPLTLYQVNARKRIKI